MSKWVWVLPMLMVMTTVEAAVLKFSWDPVDDARVGVYVLKWGYNSADNGGSYAYGSAEVAAPTTEVTTPDIQLPDPAQQKVPGHIYFVVQACTTDKSLCSDYSNVVDIDLRSITIPTGLRVLSLTFGAEQ